MVRTLTQRAPATATATCDFFMRFLLGAGGGCQTLSSNTSGVKRFRGPRNQGGKLSLEEWLTARRYSSTWVQSTTANGGVLEAELRNDAGPSPAGARVPVIYDPINPNLTTDARATGISLPTEPGAEEFIESAHELCDTFDKTTDEDAFEALRGSTSDKKRTAGQILMLLCSDSERYMQIVVAVEIPEARASGTYYVGDGDDEITPGDYRTIGGVRNCYWVRKDKKGEIIDNDLVSNAPGGVRMTGKASDYEVTMERCGLWIPN